MTMIERLIMIGAVVAGTMTTRFLPFLLFPSGKETPTAVRYLGRTLPPAVFALLVVYSLKDVSVTHRWHGIPELLCSLLVVGLHLWKKSMLLSIAAGTIVYMVLVQRVFV